MNIITQTLPARVSIEGKSYRVKTDFRVWLKAMDVLEKYPIEICTAILTPACYIDLPRSADDALRGILSFLNPDGAADSSGKKIIDFEADAEYIYSAFYTQYGIDLNTSSMHYYKFKALLLGLCGEHNLLKIMDIRNTNLADIKDAQLRQKYAALKKNFRIISPAQDFGECIFSIMKGGDTYGTKKG